MKDIFKIRRIALGTLYSSLGSFVIGAVVMSGGTNIAGMILLAMGCILLATFIILGVAYWRCPFCHNSFELRCGVMDNISICPFCGKRLRD